MNAKLPEDFLHFIWAKQRFNSQGLATTDGETITVLYPGLHNAHAGPDFEAARIRIGTQEWAGNVEIHWESSDWQAHEHDKNPNYNNVILHVVWRENVRPTLREEGTPIPTLVLEDRVARQMVLQYEKFIFSSEKIPCQAHFPTVSTKLQQETLSEKVRQRLERKAREVLELLERNQGNWEESFYQLLGKSYGFKINAAPFLSLTQSLPLKILQKHRMNALQVEALILGQAGFLDRLSAEEKENYPLQLQKEYQFLAKKYGIFEQRLTAKQWKKARVRPSNTPTVRLLQFASLLAQEQHLFSRMMEAKKLASLLSLFKNHLSPYWKTHYALGKQSHSRPFPQMGRTTKEVILANTVMPVRWAYLQRQDLSSEELKNAQTTVIQLLGSLSAEKNSIISDWESLGLQFSNAAQTQGALELYNEYCTKKRCLACGIGRHLLE